MSLAEAVHSIGPYPTGGTQAQKKGYAERLSNALADAVATGLRERGFRGVKPDATGGREKAFQGGLGTKRVDVSYADERNGLMLAVTIKTIGVAPFGKNLKNRFGDLCTEAITLHMRFPFAVVAALFAFPEEADADVTPGRPRSTFARATELMDTVNSRGGYTDAGERFESVTMMLYGSDGAVQLFDAASREGITEARFFDGLLALYNRSNPHTPIGEPALEES